jgi:hypothetical protein
MTLTQPKGDDTIKRIVPPAGENKRENNNDASTSFIFWLFCYCFPWKVAAEVS